MQKRISVINFKGGVGKTSVAFHLATGLARFHHARVLLVDVDHQSSLSIVCLGSSGWERASASGYNINAIFTSFILENQPLPGREIIISSPRPNYPSMDVVSSTLQLDETEIDLTSTNLGDPIKSEWSKRSLLCKWISNNNIEEMYDYIIFDCPPATKLVTQNAIAASHGFITPVIPEAVSIRGVPHLVNSVMHKVDGKFGGLADYLIHKGEQIPSSYVRNTRFLGVIISKIKEHGMAHSGFTSDQTVHLEQLTREFGDFIISPYIVEGVGVPECLTAGDPVYDHPDWSNVQNRQFPALFEELVANIKYRMDII